MKKTKLFLGTLVLGLTLTITPPLALADTYYTVKPGDSLWKIANSYNITLEQIRELNYLDSTLIFPGQSILVAKDVDRSKALEVSRGTSLAVTYHTVKPGDSLWKIAGSYGITVEQIKELNSLDSSLLSPGQTLLVTKDADRSKAVEVSRGTSRVEKILDYAKSLAGVPYRYGGQSPAGFDCSGYILYVFRNFGIELPRVAEDQFIGGRRVTEKEARPGDIVAFKNGNQIDHTGIYLGGGKFISATSNCGVEISSINGPYWSKRLLGFSRIMP